MNPNIIPPSDKYEMSGIESLLSGPPTGAEKGYLPSSSSFDSVGYDPVPADTRDPMSKFFGLTGTTSHDIQVKAKRTHSLKTLILTKRKQIYCEIMKRSQKIVLSVGINVHRALPLHPLERHQLHVQRGRTQRHDGLQLQHNQASDHFLY